MTIKNLDPSKAHGHDMISIRMIKLCSISICKPLEIIFQNCLRTGKFPSERRKTNVVPTFKKGDKQCIKNYRPVYRPIIVQLLSNYHYFITTRFHFF